MVKPCDMIGIADAPSEVDSSTMTGMPLLDLPFGIVRDFNGNARGLPLNNPVVQALLRRHDGRWITGFCDGHVESLRAKDLWNINDDGVLRRWNIDNQPHRVRTTRPNFPLIPTCLN